MPKRQPLARPIQTFNRPGEGASIQITGKEVTSGPRGEVVSINFDLTNAPVPERQYVATLASVVMAEEFVHLLFGQKKTAGAGLRSLVDVQVTPEALRRFTKSLAGFDEARSRSGISAGSLASFEDEPPQTVGLSANVLAMSFTGIESCIDLYKISPFVMGNLARGGNLLADPVVRVSLPTRMLFAMIDRFQQLWSGEGDAKQGTEP